MSYQDRIEAYLNIDGRPARYFTRDPRPSFFKPRVFIGKGSPEEIADATQRGFNVGIDCSGLICHILEGEKPIKTIIQHDRRSLLNLIRFILRPIENTDIRLLIHQVNSLPTQVDRLEPLDLIHFGKEHALLVTANQGGDLTYINSSSRLGMVTVGEIHIENPDLPLGNQWWSEKSVRQAFQNNPNAGLTTFKRI